jgi:hypothetical protein
MIRFGLTSANWQAMNRLLNIANEIQLRVIIKKCEKRIMEEEKHG